MESAIGQGLSCGTVTGTPSPGLRPPLPTAVRCGFPSQRAPDMPSSLALGSASSGSLPRATPTLVPDVSGKRTTGRHLLGEMTCPTSHLGVLKHQALELCDFRQGPSLVCALAPTRWPLGKYRGPARSADLRGQSWCSARAQRVSPGPRSLCDRSRTQSRADSLREARVEAECLRNNPKGRSEIYER